jgi:protein TonB
MFEDALLGLSSGRTCERRRIHYLISALAESMLVGTLVLVPFIYTQALPKQFLIGQIHVSAPPGPPSEHPTGPRPRLAPHPAVDAFTAPSSIPQGITPVVDPPQAPEMSAGLGVIGAVPGGMSNGTLNELMGSLSPGTAPPPPPTPHVAPRPQMIRVGGDVIAAQAVYQPQPVYPPLAIAARVQGTVVLQAIIGKDGSVQNLKVLSGHPLLVHAAIDAVRSWRYQPTLLDLEPVDVLTEVDVKFSLSQ